MNINENFVKNLVAKCIGDVTGEDYYKILKKSTVKLDRRDYIEIIQRLESILDCTLDMLTLDDYKIDIYSITSKIIKVNTSFLGK